jgi:hypothetical protein
MADVLIMGKHKYSVLISGFLTILFSCNSTDDRSDSLINLTAAEVYSQTINMSVTIETEISQGSGFFIDSSTIVTNYHVIEGATEATVKLNDTDKQLTVIGYLAVDKVNDLILLTVDHKSPAFLKIEESVPSPGEKVFAIGTPVGLRKTISEGIVSGIRANENRKLLQITAPISPGSSGGPILNEKGNLVGVAVGGIADANNIGFCIPAIFVKSLIDFKEVYSKDIVSLLPKKNDVSTANNKTNVAVAKAQNENISADKSGKRVSGLKKSSSNALNKIYLGQHKFRISTIAVYRDDQKGTVNIFTKDGKYYINGYTENIKEGRWARISGVIKIIDLDNFEFIGKIDLHNPSTDYDRELRQNTGSACSDCSWDGTINFTTSKLYSKYSGDAWINLDNIHDNIGSISIYWEKI